VVGFNIGCHEANCVMNIFRDLNYSGTKFVIKKL